MSRVVLDFSSSVHYLLALLPETVLSVTAMAVLLGDVLQRGRSDRPSARWTGILTVTGVLAASIANLALLSFDVPNGYSMVAVDGFGVAVNFLILGATLVGLLFSFGYLEREGLQHGEVYALVLLAAVGMMVLAAARDLILVFLGLELMSLSVYILVCFPRREPRATEAALKYFLIGAFASAFLLYGIALLFGATGSTNLSLVAAEVAKRAQERNLLLLGGIGMLLIGFGFKIAAVPFHMWTPDAYEGAAAPITGFMAAGVKVAAFAALIRVVTVQLAPAAATWKAILWWLAMLTMIVPNLIALAQDNVKRMLAYSSIAHAGYLLVAVVAGGEMGRAAALFYLGVYALMTLGAFGIVQIVSGRGERRLHLSDYRGLGWERPFLGMALVVFLLSLAGFPPTGGFVGKLFILRAALTDGQVALAVTLVLATLVSYYYYLRVVWKMYFDEMPEGASATPASGGAFRFAAVVSAVGVLLAGLLPGPAIRSIESAAATLEPVGEAPNPRPPAPPAALSSRPSVAPTAE